MPTHMILPSQNVQTPGDVGGVVVFDKRLPVFLPESPGECTLTWRGVDEHVSFCYNPITKALANPMPPRVVANATGTEALGVVNADLLPDEARCALDLVYIRFGVSPTTVVYPNNATFQVSFLDMSKGMLALDTFNPAGPAWTGTAHSAASPNAAANMDMIASMTLNKHTAGGFLHLVKRPAGLYQTAPTYAVISETDVANKIMADASVGFQLTGLAVGSGLQIVAEAVFPGSPRWMQYCELVSREGRYV